MAGTAFLVQTLLQGSDEAVAPVFAAALEAGRREQPEPQEREPL